MINSTNIFHKNYHDYKGSGLFMKNYKYKRIYNFINANVCKNCFKLNREVLSDA